MSCSLRAWAKDPTQDINEIKHYARNFGVIIKDVKILKNTHR